MNTAIAKVKFAAGGTGDVWLDTEKKDVDDELTRLFKSRFEIDSIISVTIMSEKLGPGGWPEYYHHVILK